MARFEVLCADSEELRNEVFRLRYDVYVRQMGRRQMYADHDRGTIEEPMDITGRNFIALLDGRPIGTLRGNTLEDPLLSYYSKIYDLSRFGFRSLKHVQITTKLMIRPEYKGSSYAPRMIHAYASDGYRKGVRVDFIDCNRHLIDFFERMGYCSYRGWAFHKEFGTVRPMFLAVDAVTYLRSLRSFLAEAAAPHVTDGEYGGYELMARHAECPRSQAVQEVLSRFLPPSDNVKAVAA